MRDKVLISTRSKEPVLHPLYFICCMSGTKGLEKLFFLGLFFFFPTCFTNEPQLPLSTGAGENQKAPFKAWGYYRRLPRYTHAQALES